MFVFISRQIVKCLIVLTTFIKLMEKIIENNQAQKSIITVIIIRNVCYCFVYKST